MKEILSYIGIFIIIIVGMIIQIIRNHYLFSEGGILGSEKEDSIADEIEKLAKLHDRGYITSEQFEDAKQKIIERGNG